MDGGTEQRDANSLVGLLEKRKIRRSKLGSKAMTVIP